MVRKPRRASTSVEEKRRKARLGQVESLIASLEEQLNVISHRLENPPADPERVQKLGREYVRVQEALDELMGEWEILSKA